MKLTAAEFAHVRRNGLHVTEKCGEDPLSTCRGVQGQVRIRMRVCVDMTACIECKKPESNE